MNTYIPRRILDFKSSKPPYCVREPAMSDEEDVSLASDQDQIDDQLNDEDAGGLFGSGSEDEQSGYEALFYYEEEKLKFGYQYRER